MLFFQLYQPFIFVPSRCIRQLLRKYTNTENIVFGEGLTLMQKHHPKQPEKWSAYQNQKVVQMYYNLSHIMKLCCSRIFTNFTTKLASLGLTQFEKNITTMANYQTTQGKITFCGETSSCSPKSSRVQLLSWGTPASSGMTFRADLFIVRPFLSYFLLQD